MDKLNLTTLREKYQNTEAVSSEIRSEAEEIRKTRDKNATAIKSTVDRIKERKESIITILSDIESEIRDMTDNACPSDKREKILSYCSSIRTDYGNYHRDAKELASRFEHAKINIIAYGEPGQGKSSFVKHFTGLPDEIVAEHPDGDGRDKTGAMNIYIWDSKHKGESKIEVVFKTKEVFKKQVIDNLKALRVTKMNDIDVSRITINDISSWIGSEENKVTIDGKTVSMTEIAGGDMGAKKMIDHVFEKETNLGELSDEPNKKVRKKISEIPVYNDMTHPGIRKWMTVEKIIVTINAGDTDYLRYFEIRDTKGISVQAGGENAEKDVFDQLLLCDAAFSISMPGGPHTDPLSFYNNKVRRFCEKNQTFQDKNFVICNPFLGEKVKETKDNFISSIGSAAIANTCYDGILKNNEAGDFVKLLMLDMLKKIVKVVKKEDNRLIQECNKYAISIKEEIQGLNNEIQSLDVKPVNVDHIIKTKIDTFKAKADEEIINELFNGKNPLQKDDSKGDLGKTFSTDDDDDDATTDNDSKTTKGGKSYSDSLHVEYTDEMYKKVLEDKQSLSVFQLLTNKKEDIKHRNDTAQDAIKNAISFIWDEIKGKDTCNKEDFGKYVDERVGEINKKLEENTSKKIAETLLEQSKEGITKMFTIIWKQFQLDKLIGEFSKESFEELSNTNCRIKSWYDIYTEKRRDPQKPAFLWCRSYDVLQRYFSNGVKEVNMTKGNFINVIDNVRLKEAIVSTIDLGQVIKHIIDQSYFMQLNAIYKDVFTKIYNNFSLLALPEVLEELLPLYRDRLEDCERYKIVDDPKNEIKNSELYEAIKRQRDLLLQQGNNEIPKIEVN